MKILKTLLASLLIVFLFLITARTVSADINIFKPPLTWQRSTEAPDKVVQETTIGSKVNEALQLPLDPSQTDFDNGVSTPTVNKNAVAAGIEWASWIQYSAPSPTVCGTIFELRRFQANFNLPTNFNSSQVKKVSLRSPYYAGDTFPINDNAYIHINGNFVKKLGTNYGATNVGPSGTGPYANETDGWVANGDLGIASAGFLKPGQNTIDIAAGERCHWGGMGKLELVLEIEGPIPSPEPAPFLDLPWDYENEGLSFSEAALAINSYFDHEYPLLSTSLNEPTNKQNQVTTFQAENSTSKKYSTHDGYDYGKDAKALIGDPILAAAAGCASYFNDGATGNAIKIDHGNGYQTRYYHLSENDLVTKSATCTNVTKGQQIGRVGATGNVIPPGDLGAHIHFMVVQDKNNDGNFDDNIPDGVTDPFGWQSAESDPWEIYNFFYNGQDRTGNKSYYLWTNAIVNLSGQLSPSGGSFELEKYKMEFLEGATDQNLTVDMQMAPVAKPSNLLESIGATLVATAKNASGQFVEEFTKPYTISIDFGAFDLSTLNLATISIHSSEDGVNWQKENTIVDLENEKATAQLNHLSYFALMAERLDTIAPTTTAILDGKQGEPNWFRSDVQLNLNPQDNPGGLGVDYTLYKIDDQDWQQYMSPSTITNEGQHTVEFYSVDIDENIEEIKSVSFTIDKTIPEAKIFIDQNVLDLVVQGIDNNSAEVNVTNSGKFKRIYTVTDPAGNKLIMDARGFDSKKRNSFLIYSLAYNQNSPILAPKNLYVVTYQGKPARTNVKYQYFVLKNVTIIKISYNKKKDQSSIYTLQGRKLKLSDTRDGLVLLQLVTNQGNLEFSY